MSTNVAPWLQGLSDGWEPSQIHHTKGTISSASHDAHSLRSSRSRIPRRSLSGLPSSFSSQRVASAQRTREPLGSLSTNDANSMRRRLPDGGPVDGTLEVDGSDGCNSVGGTVQQRSKSTSPAKAQQTLEWKRRLVHGKVGYGDQTDLFGPSGLENIFAKSSKDGEVQAVPSMKRPSWLTKAGAKMPSSPPPWPSSFTRQMLKESKTEPSSTLGQEQDYDSDGSTQQGEDAGSLNSNPFDLESHDDAAVDGKRQSSPRPESSPNVSGELNTFEQDQEQPDERAVCGPTELEQEDFSPVFVSKHTTARGQIDYAAFDSHLVKQFHSMRVELRHPSQHQPEHTPEEQMNKSILSDEGESQLHLTAPDISFSENLPTGSPMPNLSQNVEFRRGGYSQYGSFKTRPLSPSPNLADSPHIHSASTLQPPVTSQEFEGLAETSSLREPSTPKRTKEEPKSRSSGSPLKLFDTHDTFTSNRLLRRLSQLNLDGTLKVTHGAPSEKEEECKTNLRQASAGSSFGSGELDGHSFVAEITITSASDSDRGDSDRSPGSEVLVPGSKMPFEFRREPFSDSEDPFYVDRKSSRKIEEFNSDAEQAMSASLENVQAGDNTEALMPEQTREYLDGKRPPSSPAKYPTPKRRRTLHASEIQDGIFASTGFPSNQFGDTGGSRKRKDARHGDIQNTADPETLAHRKMLRPRNPTPSQRRRERLEQELKQATEQFVDQEPERLEAVIEQIESSMAADSPPSMRTRAETLASEVAAFTLRVRKPSSEPVDGERKRSVTTQDFLNEALMVMDLIRARARPQSNLGSVEESDAEAFGQSVQADVSQQEESLLRVSRPPSREGSGWRSGAAPINNARVMSHLRKYQEQEERDETDFIADSDKLLDIDDEDEHINEQVVVIDENSNIRISGPSPIHMHQHDLQVDGQQSQPSTLDTQSTQCSKGESTTRTAGSNSTRKSDNVGTLAPDAVAHLIGSEVGGMTFDKEKQRWIRVARSPEKGHGSFLEPPSMITSDDDPLREFSDLPVDEQIELRRISVPQALNPVATAADHQSFAQDHAEEDAARKNPMESRTGSNETVISRPLVRESSQLFDAHSSSAPSRYTALASSQQAKIETRATSWNEEELRKGHVAGNWTQQPSHSLTATPHSASDALDDVSEVYSPSLASPSPHQPSVVSIRSESQADIGLDETPSRPTDSYKDTALDSHQPLVEEITSPKLRQTPGKATQPSSPAFRSATRQVSLRRKTLTNRWTAEAHEHGELSFVASLPGARMMSLSLSVSKPLSKIPHRQVTEWQTSPSKEASTFLLSDLPDFTIHEEDEERPSEKALAVRVAQHAAEDVNDRYAVAVRELVKALTDTNEDDPFWEDLRHLNLHCRSLVSLHGLAHFCTNIQDIDVSQNALTHVLGAPSSIRRLNASFNQLSNLTSWNHLTNLQYLDISNNGLESLDSLANLYHLRELVANDNEITNMDGLLSLDGLLRVCLRGNQLQAVDFENCQLRELTFLDLCGNQLTQLKHLDQLPSLAVLKVDGNNFKDGLQATQTMPRLTSLSMRDCNAETFDIAPFPGIAELNLDDNRISHIDRLGELKHPNVLSMRRQTLRQGSSLSVFDAPMEASSVFLSGSPLSSINLCTKFLNIRHLELASMGLQTLPDDFGLQMPNLRTLNLNFNNLRDVRPLLNIHKLERLSVCRNRIDRLRKTVATLAKLTSLRSLDLRDNPLTQGFYSSLDSTMSGHMSLIRAMKINRDEEEAEKAAMLEKSRYEVLPSEREQDQTHRSRLDEETKLRRRVYEILLANACQQVKSLDGLTFDRSSTGARDETWDRLVELGIIRRSQQSTDALEI